MFLRRFLMPSLLVALAATSWVGCEKDDDGEDLNTSYTVSGSGSGLQEVPTVSTSGSSSVTGTYAGKVLGYTVTWNNLSANATMMHFHGPADPGTNAGVMIPITGFTEATSGSYSGVVTLTPAQDSALLAGKMYYNVHTSTNPGGEVRAQLGVAER